VTTSTTTEGSDGSGPSGYYSLRRKITRRSGVGRADKAFAIVALASGVAVLVILALIAFSTTKEAWPAFREEGFGFVTSKTWNPNGGEFGALAFIYGTLAVATIAVVLAVPVSIGVALFITEVVPNRLRPVVVTVIDLLAAVPSVVWGLWGVAVLGEKLLGTYEWIAARVGSIPVLNTLFSGAEGGSVQKKSFMTAGIILAIMITPIITSIIREVFATVPTDDKAGALALGATGWEMVRGVVLPYSRTGIVGAVMLGLGRAMGETIAVALVIGSVPALSAHLFGPGDAMAGVIANQFGEASGNYRAALIGLGVVLFIITIFINVAARTITTRADRRLGVR
jgi:phosphate transport system permease protein